MEYTEIYSVEKVQTYLSRNRDYRNIEFRNIEIEKCGSIGT